MKKIIFTLLLLIPIFVKADEIVAENVKYYKTITALNDGIYNDLNNTIITRTEEISAEEYNNANPNRYDTTVETAYKRLTVSISTYGNYYKYQTHLHWKNIPKVRSYDIIGIGHYASVTPGLAPVFLQEYCNVDGNCYTSQTNYSKIIDGGFSALFYLPSGNLTSLDQTLSAVMRKKNANSTIISQKAVGDYAHAVKSISYNNAKKHSMEVGGLYLQSSIISYYDDIPYAEASWSGNW